MVKKKPKYRITDHAVSRYCERMYNLYGMNIKRPIKAMRWLLDRSTPESLTGSHVKRLMRYGWEGHSYLVTQGWRFVISKDGSVITVMRINNNEN